MIGVVNKITILQIETQKVGENYQIIAFWSVNQGPGDVYKGPFHMEVWHNNQLLNSQEILDKNNGIITVSSINTEEIYYLKISIPAYQVLCDQVPILFHTYQAVSGEYTGEMMYLSWDKTPYDIGGGNCNIIPSQGAAFVFPLEQNSRHIDIPLSIKDLNPNEVLKVNLVPFGMNIVYGPPSTAMIFLTEPVKITGIGSSPIGDLVNKVKLNVHFTITTQLASNMKAKVILQYNGKDKEVFTNVPILADADKEGNYTINISVEKELLNPDIMEDYEIVVFLHTENAVSSIISDVNRVSLPETNIFRRGFYPVVDNNKFSMALRLSEAAEKQAVVIFEEELFKTPITQDIVSGMLTLSFAKPYHLTIQTLAPLGRSDYQNFFTLLGEKGITSMGVYQLQEAISKYANQNNTDMLYFHCGLDESTLMVDIKKGFTLRVETEVFTPRYSGDSEVPQGYISNHVREYMVSTRYNDNDIFLEFDSFIDCFADNLYYSPKDALVAGGVQDFFQKGFRQPFYRICYPAGFIDSSLEESAFPSDHVTLLGGSTYGAIMEISKEIVKNSAYLNNQSSIPILFFRGRSVVTLCISLWINNQLLVVPVGKTLGKLLEHVAIYNVGEVPVKLQRITNAGYMEVRLDSIMDKEKKNRFIELLPLMHGDRIEV